MLSLPALLLATAAPLAETVTVDPPQYGLPTTAVILEARLVPHPAPPRAIVLWLDNPVRKPRPDPQEPYTCPEVTLGHTLSGPTRASLLDLEHQRLINTVVIRDPCFPRDSYELPYRIRAGSYFRVDQTDSLGEGVPVILDFRDVNGDGIAQEFVLYHSLGCMGLATALIGYSPRADAVIHYPVSLLVTLKGKESTTIEYWPDYLFSEHPDPSGLRKYQIDYRGRGGCLDTYEVRYVPQDELFTGTLVETDCSPEP